MRTSQDASTFQVRGVQGHRSLVRPQATFRVLRNAIRHHCGHQLLRQWRLRRGQILALVLVPVHGPSVLQRSRSMPTHVVQPVVLLCSLLIYVRAYLYLFHVVVNARYASFYRVVVRSKRRLGLRRVRHSRYQVPSRHGVDKGCFKHVALRLVMRVLYNLRRPPSLHGRP